MSDREQILLQIEKYLDDENKRILLLKGYDNEAKINAVLVSLNKRFTKGIIRTSSMQDISGHINGAFKNNLVPSSVTSTSTYNIGKIKINFNSYSSHTRNNPKGNDSTFTIYFPVQYALNDSKRLKNLIDDIKKCASKKVILITTNEWSIKNWDIEHLVDEILFYSVENDNPDIMMNLRNNKAID